MILDQDIPRIADEVVSRTYSGEYGWKRVQQFDGTYNKAIAFKTRVDGFPEAGYMIEGIFSKTHPQDGPTCQLHANGEFVTATNERINELCARVFGWKHNERLISNL